MHLYTSCNPLRLSLPPTPPTPFPQREESLLLERRAISPLNLAPQALKVLTAAADLALPQLTTNKIDASLSPRILLAVNKMASKMRLEIDEAPRLFLVDEVRQCREGEEMEGRKEPMVE